ncbi:hypothetical protein GQ54DRAFT_7750 [Martensiomyces pterosporus]|nr:hypothetical protein GQ54DRAFT_7750 [Martensiomyces pterosporus]
MPSHLVLFCMLRVLRWWAQGCHGMQNKTSALGEDEARIEAAVTRPKYLRCRRPPREVALPLPQIARHQKKGLIRRTSEGMGRKGCVREQAQECTSRFYYPVSLEFSINVKNNYCASIVEAPTRIHFLIVIARAFLCLLWMSLIDLSDSDDGGSAVRPTLVRFDHDAGPSNWKLGSLDVAKFKRPADKPDKAAESNSACAGRPASMYERREAQQRTVFDSYLSDESDQANPFINSDNEADRVPNKPCERRYLNRNVTMAPGDSMHFAPPPVWAGDKKNRRSWSTLGKCFHREKHAVDCSPRTTAAPRVRDSGPVSRVLNANTTLPHQAPQKSTKIKRHESWISSLKLHVQRSKSRNPSNRLVPKRSKGAKDSRVAARRSHSIESSDFEGEESADWTSPVPRYPPLRSQPPRRPQTPHSRGCQGGTFNYSRSDIAFVADLDNLTDRHGCSLTPNHRKPVPKSTQFFLPHRFSKAENPFSDQPNTHSSNC